MTTVTAPATVVLHLSAGSLRVGDRFTNGSRHFAVVDQVHQVQRHGCLYAVLPVEDSNGLLDTVRWPARQTVTVTRALEEDQP